MFYPPVLYALINSADWYKDWICYTIFILCNIWKMYSGTASYVLSLINIWAPIPLFSSYREISAFLLQFWLDWECALLYSFIPLTYAECDDSLPFSGASSIPLCYVLFPATLLHQLVLHSLSPHVAIYFLVCLSILLFTNSNIILFLGILFPSILCTCPNQHNPVQLIVSWNQMNHEDWSLLSLL